MRGSQPEARGEEEEEEEEEKKENEAEENEERKTQDKRERASSPWRSWYAPIGVLRKGVAFQRGGR